MLFGMVGDGSAIIDGMRNISTSDSQYRVSGQAAGPARRSGHWGGWGSHTTLAVIIIGLIFSVTVFLVVRQQTITHLTDNLGVQAERATETFQRRIRVVEDTTRALGALFSACDGVSPEEFSGFVDHILPEGNGIDLLFWTSLSSGPPRLPYRAGLLAKAEHFAALERSPGLRNLLAAALAGQPVTTRRDRRAVGGAWRRSPSGGRDPDQARPNRCRDWRRRGVGGLRYALSQVAG